MELIYRTEFKKGFNQIISVHNSPLKLIEFGILKLSEKEKWNGASGDKESGLVILSGKCSIKAGSQDFKSIGARTDVFSARAHAVYIPPKTSYTVIAESDVEIAVASAPSSASGQPQLVMPQDNISKSVGKDNWRRDVNDIIMSNVRAEKLLIGETINPAGNWSSYPPHRHEKDNLPEESELEEVYFYRLKPDSGFGLQRIYTDDGRTDEVYTVRNNDTIAIPRGYHPVVAAPGYQLYYFWVLAGPKRIMKPLDDPAHKWIKNQ